MSTKEAPRSATSGGGAARPIIDDITMKKDTSQSSNNNKISRKKRRKESSQKRQKQQQPQQQQLIECKGRPKEALGVYRKLFYQYESEGRSKPDMQAYSHLKKDWTSPRKHGELRDVPIGLHLSSRGEAAILGIHCKILNGIDATKDEPCYAVCISGGYDDDEDCSFDDGTIYYTGEGGRDKRRKHVEDQKETVGNKALIRSYQIGTTIRVVRGTSPNYYYLGLYRCTDYTYEPSGLHGKKVYKFKLEPLMEHQCPKARAMPLKVGGGRRRSSTTLSTNDMNNKLMKFLQLHPHLSLQTQKKLAEAVGIPAKKESGILPLKKLEEEDSTTTTMQQEPPMMMFKIPRKSSLPPPQVKKLEEGGIVTPKLEDNDDDDGSEEEEVSTPQEPMPKRAKLEQEDSSTLVLEDPMPRIPRKSSLPTPATGIVRIKMEDLDSDSESEEEEEEGLVMEEDEPTMPKIPQKSSLPPPAPGITRVKLEDLDSDSEDEDE